MGLICWSMSGRCTAVSAVYKNVALLVLDQKQYLIFFGLIKAANFKTQ